MYVTSKQRFVKEYANWKISILEDMAKAHPEKAMYLTVQVTLIRECVKKWDNGMVMTDEAMQYIAERG